MPKYSQYLISSKKRPVLALVLAIGFAVMINSFMINHAAAQSAQNVPSESLIASNFASNSNSSSNHNQPYTLTLAPVKHQLQHSNQSISQDYGNSTKISEQKNVQDINRSISVQTAGLNYSFNRDQNYHDSAQKKQRVMQVNILKYK